MSLFQEIHDIAKKRFERQAAVILDESFEELKFQRIEHAKTLEKIVEMHEDFKMGRIVASDRLKTMLLEWRMNHASKVKKGEDIQ